MQGTGTALVLTVRVTGSHQAVMLLNRPLTLTARTPDRRTRTGHWRQLDRSAAGTSPSDANFSLFALLWAVLEY